MVFKKKEKSVSRIDEANKEHAHYLRLFTQAMQAENETDLPKFIGKYENACDECWEVVTQNEFLSSLFFMFLFYLEIWIQMLDGCVLHCFGAP